MLFPKQVHLQKDVGAGDGLSWFRITGQVAKVAYRRQGRWRGRTGRSGGERRDTVGASCCVIQENIFDNAKNGRKSQAKPTLVRRVT